MRDILVSSHNRTHLLEKLKLNILTIPCPPSVWQDVEKLQFPNNIVGNLKLYSHTGKLKFLKVLTSYLPCDPIILLLWTQPREMIVHIPTQTSTQIIIRLFLGIINKRKNPNVHQRMIEKYNQLKGILWKTPQRTGMNKWFFTKRTNQRSTNCDFTYWKF